MAQTAADQARAKPKKFQSPGHYTDKDREKIKHFAGPGTSFPIEVPQDVADAAELHGHADNPAQVKANIIKIAHQLGPEFVAKLPKEWTEGADDDSDRATAEPEETREADTLTRITLPAEVRIVDAAKREFEVCATSEAIDTYGTVFSFEATKDAFLRWKRNIREMHAPLAVGRGIEVRFDDDAKKTYVRGRVSRGAESTWLKLEDGVLQGASIGASNVRWERRLVDGREVPVATAYDLVELSLVDNPSNPDAYGVTLVRSATPAADVWQSDQEVADEERAAFRDAAEADLAAEETRDMAGVPQLGPNVGAAPGGTPVAVTAPATSAAAAAGGTSATADAAVATFAPGSALPSAPIAPPLPAQARAVAQAQREMPEALRREREGKAEAAYIRLAGDRAVAEAGLDAFDPNTGTYDMYIQRVAAIRAPAEVAAMLDYRAKKRKSTAAAAAAAAAAEKAPEAGAAGVATPAASDVESDDDDDDDGERAAVAATAAAAVAAAPEATRGSLSDTTHVIGQVQMGPRGVAASENLDSDRHGHVHTHAHGGDFERHGAGGTHSHVHMHLDGTEHDHPHLHDHDHGDHATLTARAAASAAGGATEHSHEHKHVHDHLHTFRAGTPTDARLMTPDALRAPFGSPADASDNRKPPRKGSTASGTLAVGTGAHGGEVSPVLSVQPQAVGHRVLYNTEDAAALEAGVPAAAEQRPTPTGDITLNDANFHEGGHPTGAEGPDRMTHDGGPADEYDDDGDHDGGADDEPQTPARPPAPAKRQPVSRPTPGGTPSNGPSVGMGQVSGPRSVAAAAVDAIATLLAQGLISEDAAEQMRAAAGANESNMGVVHVDAGTQGAAPGADEDDDRDDYAEAEGNDGDADDVATPARPPRAMPRQSTDRPGLDVGKNPADTGLSPYLSPQRPADAAPLGKAGGLHGSSQAGARAAGSDVTVATQTRVGARISAESRQMLHSVRDQALASVKAACAHCNGSGNECPECADLMTVLNGGAFDATGDHSSDDDQQPNVQSDTALFGNLRVMTALFQRDIARGFRDLRVQYEERFAEQQALIEDLTVRLADAQLTLADHQRGTAAEVTRSVEAQMQTRMEAMTQHIQDALTDGLTTRLAPTIEQALAPLSQRVEGVAADAAGLKADVARIADQPAILGGPATGVALKRFAGTDPNGNGPGGQQALSADDEMAVLARFADSLPQSDMDTRMKIAARQAALSAQPYALGGRGALPGAPRARR